MRLRDFRRRGQPGHCPIGPTLLEWRDRPLREITYLYLDTRDEKVRENSQIRDAAVLIATGIIPKPSDQS